MIIPDSRKNLALLLVIIIMAASFFACKEHTVNSVSTSSTSSPVVTSSAEDVPVISFNVETKQGAEYIGADTVVTLADNDIKINGAGATSGGSVLTITKQGTYLLSGKLSDGQIIVNTTDPEKVKLVFSGVEIYCSDNAPIYVINAPKKVILYTVKGSINIIEDNAVYNVDASDSDSPKAAIFSMEDLKLDGEGEMYVTGNYSKGIMSKDDLEITGGSWYVKSADDGIRGKDSVEMSGGYVSIDAGADGLRSSNDSDIEKGYITISGGELYIKATLDAIQAETSVTITGGKIVVFCGGGSINGAQKNKVWGQGGPGRGQNPSQSSSNTKSAKGIKGNDAVIIQGGTISIDSSDDAIHSNKTVMISGGNLLISSGDDGIHADDMLNISGGVIDISKSYEGIESANIEISGGVINITASDDGINASDGSGTGTMGLGGPGNGNDALYIRISGGDIRINAGADGIDSNGNMFLDGGTIYAVGSSDPESAIDADGTILVSGGTVVGIGSAGHMESPSESSAQPTLMVIFTVEQMAGAMIKLTDGNGNVVFEGTSDKKFQSFFFTDTTLIKGGKYTLFVDGNKKATITLKTAITICSETGGEVSKNNGGMGGQPGRPQDGRR